MNHPITVMAAVLLIFKSTLSGFTCNSEDLCDYWTWGCSRCSRPRVAIHTSKPFNWSVSARTRGCRARAPGVFYHHRSVSVLDVYSLADPHEATLYPINGDPRPLIRDATASTYGQRNSHQTIHLSVVLRVTIHALCVRPSLP